MVLVLAGCHASQDRWGATRETCGMDEGEAVVYPNASIAEFNEPFIYSEACARRIGDDLGADWDAFGDLDLPGHFRGPTLVRAIAGGWLLLGMDIGTVGDVLEDPSIPPRLADDMRSLAEGLAIEEGEPGSRLVYDYVVNGIRSVVPREGHYDVSIGYSSGVLYLPTEEYTDRPYEWADTLVHEAGHANSGLPHDDCGSLEPDWEVTASASKDAAWDGVWGFSAFVSSRLRAKLTGAYYDEMAHVLSRIDGVFCDGADVPVDIYEGDRWE